MDEHYRNWLRDNEFSDSEENREQWFNTHCQFCGCENVFGNCGCDHQTRYSGEA